MELYIVEYTEDGVLKRCFEGSIHNVMKLERALIVCDEHNVLFPECDYRVVKLVPEYCYTALKLISEYKLQELQAQIDRLRLEFCPEDMTEEQIKVWGSCQKSPKTNHIISAGDIVRFIGDVDNYIDITSYKEYKVESMNHFVFNFIDDSGKLQCAELEYFYEDWRKL